jgi:arginyl-tRNA synthetase
VYYVQYAHARICSVLAAWGGDPASCKTWTCRRWTAPPAQALMLLLARYPDMLTAAAADFAPHDVTFYLRELAATYHSYYDAERILVDDEAGEKRPGWRWSLPRRRCCTMAWPCWV